MRQRLVWLILFILAAGQAHAVCLNLSIINITGGQVFTGSGGGYQPYDTSEYLKTVSFDVQAQVSIAACPYFVVLRTGQSGSASARELWRGSSANKLNYQAYIDSTKANILRDSATANTSTAITGNFAVLGGTQTNHHSFVWTVPAGQVAAANASPYADNGVVLEVWEGVLGLLPVLRNTATLNFSTTVLSSVDVAVVGTGSPFAIGSTSRNVNFGTASSGAQQNFDLSIRSNDGYQISMQSANGQKLKHSISSVSTTIPYTITVSGTSQNLSSGGAVTVATSASGATTPAIGTNIPVRVTLGTLSGAETSGNYNDTLSLSITAH
ncbi:MAG: hypothetical protein GC129_05615 [Proteobacteria bacterium]|nr:hypothetical protein [Pseudomonadota bacterium]